MRKLQNVRQSSLKITLIASVALAAIYSTAQNLWNGSVSGDWGNAANWDNSSTFGPGKQIIFHTSDATNLETYLGSSARVIGGLLFTADVDSNVAVITASSAATDGSNRILTFDNGSDPVYITVAEGAEGNIAVAPGKARTTIKNDMVITHNGTGLLTYHNRNWFDDDGGNRFVIKDGPGTLQYGGDGWSLGGGVIIRDGRVKVILNGVFGTGTLTMSGGGLSSVGDEQRWFTNSYHFANSLTFCDDIDIGTLVFGPQAVGTLMSNTVLNVRGNPYGNSLVLQGPIGDNDLERTLTKTGPGTLALASANSYGGGTVVEQGRIRIGNNDSFGTEPLIVTNGTLSSNNTAARTLTNDYSFAHSIALGHLNENGTLELAGLGTLTANTTLEVISDATLSNAIGQEGGDWSLTKTGPAVLKLTLTQINTFVGGLFVKEGTLAVNNSRDRLGSGSVTLDGGILRYIGVSADAIINRDLVIGDNGGTLELNTNERYINWDQKLSGGGTLIKTGIGTLIFSGTLTHTGAVAVIDGLLQINSSCPQGGVISVNSGGALGGSGTLQRICSVADGGGLAPGSDAIGTLTLDELELQSGALCLWEVDTTDSDTVAVIGDLTLPESITVDVTKLSETRLHNRVIFTYGGTYSGPQRAEIPATGDVDAEARYEIKHDPASKRILFSRAPDGTIMLVR